MRVKRLTIIFAALLFLCGCVRLGEGGTEGGVDIYVYYAVRMDGQQASSKTVDSEKHTFSAGDDILGRVIGACLSEPESQKLRRVFPDATALLDYNLQDGLLTVNLSKEYGELFGPQLTIAESCLTLSLCQIQGVESVVVICNGEKNPNSEREDAFSSEDFVLDGKALQEFEREIILYFGSPAGSGVVSETRNVVIRENESPERPIIEQLIKGPEDKSLLPTIPKDVKLLTVLTEQKKCYVNFSEELIGGIGEDMSRRALLYYSVANSLTELEGINEVEILVNGNPYGSLFRCNYAISNAGYESTSVTLYLSDSSAEYMVPMKVPASGGGGDDPEGAVMRLLAGGIDGHGCLSALPQGTRIIYCVTSQSGECTVRLSKEYCENIGGTTQETAALDSIVLSLTGLPGVTSVRLYFENAPPDTLHLDYSQPFARDESRIHPDFR